MYKYSREQEKISRLVYENTPIDQIVQVYEGPNFLEVTGNAGRDCLTYRIYDNGQVTER
jgi:hypothetical protein